MKVHPEYLKRMIVCYAIGYYFPESWFNDNPQVKKATGETDTGVLVTWNTEGSGGNKFNLPLGNNDGFCINPLNWTTDETYADASLNYGSVFVDSNTAASVYNFTSYTEEQKKLDRQLLQSLKGEVSFPRRMEILERLVTKRSINVADAKINLKRGVIETTTYTSYIPDNPIFGDKSCHFEDWSLFTINIRLNAAKRIAAFIKK